jgi:hypothetical protein
MPVTEASLANLKPFKPGESGNPKGRPSAGAAVKEWINLLAGKDLTEDDWWEILRNKKEPGNKRYAALHLIRGLENPDIADFEPLLDGQMSLRELRAQGFNTSLVKKTKRKERQIPQGEGQDPIVVVEREIELYDRSGNAFDRIMDRTEGRPRESQELDINVKVAAEQLTDQQLIERAARLFAGPPATAFVDVPAIADGEPKALSEQQG